MALKKPFALILCLPAAEHHVANSYIYKKCPTISSMSLSNVLVIKSSSSEAVFFHQFSVEVEIHSSRNIFTSIGKTNDKITYSMPIQYWLKLRLA